MALDHDPNALEDTLTTLTHRMEFALDESTTGDDLKTFMDSLEHASGYDLSKVSLDLVGGSAIFGAVPEGAAITLRATWTSR